MNPEKSGTKAAARYNREKVGPEVSLTLRLTDRDPSIASNRKLLATCPHLRKACAAQPRRRSRNCVMVRRSSRCFSARLKEADEFYATRSPKDISDDAKAHQRQAFAGMLWSKQFYHYDVRHLA